MTFVVLFIIGILWILFGIGLIGIEYGLTGTGVIIAFWYGYKKYERDKEIDIIRYYSNKYESIKDLYKNGDIEQKAFYSKIGHLWLEEYDFYKMGYITPDYIRKIEGFIFSFIFNEIISRNGLRVLDLVPRRDYSHDFNQFMIGIIDSLIYKFNKIANNTHNEYSQVSLKLVNDLKAKKEIFDFNKNIEDYLIKLLNQ